MQLKFCLITTEKPNITYFKVNYSKSKPNNFNVFNVDGDVVSNH